MWSIAWIASNSIYKKQKKIPKTVVLASPTQFKTLRTKMRQNPSNYSMNFIYIIVLFVEIPRKFITAKLSIRKPGSSTVLII
jgi:hypothetical protein